MLPHPSKIALLLGLLSSHPSIATNPHPRASSSGLALQAPNLTQSATAAARADQVRQVFDQSYSTYRQHAFGFDQLNPLSLTGAQTRNGWGGTIVDAMDTMLIMGFQDYYNEALQWVSTINFNVSKVSQTVSVFETTIRYLGGLLSAWELSPSHEDILVKQAIQLGNSLSIAWSRGNVVPFGFLTLSNSGKSPISGTSNIAEAGTLSLEFEELSIRSGNATYGQLGSGSAKAIINAAHPLPGLPAQGINPSNAQPVGDFVTWDGGSDSYFEYLLKYALMTGNSDPTYLTSWSQAVDTMISQLIRKDSVKGLTYPASYTGGRRQYTYSHLECFMGGNWLLGGRMLGNQTIESIGLDLIETCYNSYTSTATKIGPEGFCYHDAETGETTGCNVSGSNLNFLNQHGFAITSSGYIQRPEVVESYFYAYRLTGNTIWQDRAWEAFQAIVNNTQNTFSDGVDYADITNVNQVPAQKTDNNETFFYAELLKYFYLIFSPPDLVSLDDWVFNTEAHPFPIQKAPASFKPSRTTATPKPFTNNPGSLPVPSSVGSIINDLVFEETSGRMAHRRRSHHGHN